MNETADDGKLPSGRHRLPRDAVVAHQRSRLLAATAKAVAEEGYAAVSVRHVIERSGVSRATFYQQFVDLKQCLIAANGDACERLIRDISSACDSQAAWPAGVTAAVDAGLEFTRGFPELAHLLIIADSADPRLADPADSLREQLVDLLRAGRTSAPGTFAGPELMEQALIGGVISIVWSRLSAGQLDGLLQLRPELVQLLLGPYLGVREARDIALAPWPV
jgi:AcrR family transcriptional regulator